MQICGVIPAWWYFDRGREQRCLLQSSERPDLRAGVRALQTQLTWLGHEAKQEISGVALEGAHEGPTAEFLFTYFLALEAEELASHLAFLRELRWVVPACTPALGGDAGR